MMRTNNVFNLNNQDDPETFNNSENKSEKHVISEKWLISTEFQTKFNIQILFQLTKQGKKSEKRTN